METKKSNKANLEKGKTLSILMGLTVALATVFVSFEWGTAPKQTTLFTGITELPDEPDYLPITQPETTPPPPPPKVVVADIINVVEDIEEIEQVEFISSEGTIEDLPDFKLPDIKDDEEESGDHVFMVVEDMPEFPGGDGEMLKFIGRSIKYPVIAQENGIQGRVVCSFTINTDGSVVDAEVVRGIDPSLDREALRVIGSMPKWKPGKQRGKAVRVRYTLPIAFRLQ